MSGRGLRRGPVNGKFLSVIPTNMQFLTYNYISANTDGPRDAASRKIDHIARPTKYNYQATSVGR